LISSELKAIVESIVFASEEEITSKQIKDVVDTSGLRITLPEIEETIKELNQEYKAEGRAFEIMNVSGGFSFATKKDFSRFVGKLYEEKQKKKLSQSAIETLSIIAYKQPITRNEIEFVRGVNVDYIVNSLLERDLITIHGRADSPGRPILYGTTKTFLKVLGLNSLEDLPKLKEINEILKNEEIEGITEADIELFNSVSSSTEVQPADDSTQLTLITNEIEPVTENSEELDDDDHSGIDAVEDLDVINEENDNEENDNEENDNEENDNEENDDEENDDEEGDDEKGDKLNDGKAGDDITDVAIAGISFTEDTKSQEVNTIIDPISDEILNDVQQTETETNNHKDPDNVQTKLTEYEEGNPEEEGNRNEEGISRHEQDDKE
jgi:segregation and condensation protein B